MYGGCLLCPLYPLLLAPNVWAFIAQMVDYCGANAEAIGYESRRNPENLEPNLNTIIIIVVIILTSIKINREIDRVTEKCIEQSKL